MSTTPITNEAFFKHLDLLQASIARMSANSFALRGWSVTLVAGLFALAAKDADSRLIVVSYLPVCAFWLLDGYYLFQERMFRLLFERVAAHDPSIPAFSLDASHVKGARFAGAKACFSLPLLAFHGALLLTISIVALFFRKGGS